MMQFHMAGLSERNECDTEAREITHGSCMDERLELGVNGVQQAGSLLQQIPERREGHLTLQSSTEA